jgi:hypothetical protein
MSDLQAHFIVPKQLRFCRVTYTGARLVSWRDGINDSGSQMKITYQLHLRICLEFTCDALHVAKSWTRALVSALLYTLEHALTCCTLQTALTITDSITCNIYMLKFNWMLPRRECYVVDLLSE